MANFIAVIDPDPDRRDRFVRRATPLVPLFEGLDVGSCSAPPFEVVWAADPQAPISTTSGDGAAVVFGTAIRGDRGTRVEAHELGGVWHGRKAWAPEPFDGIYAALAYDPRAGLLAGVDVLGRFPLYYFASGEVLLVGSSPELFQHHPSFRKEFDPFGLVGILLTNGLAGRHTLWQGVHRLGPGNLLTATSGESPREIPQYQLPLSDRYYARPFDEHVGLLEDALDGAVRRHVPPEPRPVLLLSGGLDSRTIAGFLDRNGISPLAVTWGRRDDIELQCAVQVARRLRFEHHIEERDTAHAVQDAETHIAWEHLASGFSGDDWGGHRALRRHGTRAVAGYNMDRLIGGNYPSKMVYSFQPYFDHNNRWGLRPALLERLLRQEVFGESVREVMALLRDRYESYSDDEYWRAWCYALHHRQRFHIGCHAWPESFGAWPIVPVVDMKVLELVCGLPPSSVNGRRLHKELVSRRFPKLASLPLDRNSYNTNPLRPGFGWRLRHFVGRRMQRVLGTLLPERGRGVERRRYYRVYDINGPGWRAVREAIEPHRRLGYEYFHPSVLDELVPPPHVQVEPADAIAGTAGMKSILGFLFWLGRQASGGTPPHHPTAAPEQQERVTASRTK